MRAAFCADARDGVLRDVERDRLVALRRQRQREAAVVAEAVEQAAARVARRGRAVLALIEKQPGLLAAPQIDVVLDAALGDGRRVSGTSPASTSTRCSSPSSSRARGSLRARMPRGLQQLAQRRDDDRQQPVHALRQRLHDQVVAVAIDDQRRQQVGFAVDQPVGGRVDRRATARNAIAASIRRRISASSAALVAVASSIRSVICDRSLKSA